MVEIDQIKAEIINRLEPLNVEQIVLFGSYAKGTPHTDSDLDLYVVTKDDYVPKNFDEKMGLKLKIAGALKDLQGIVPIDIITHTKKMHQKFIEMNSSFSKEILENGIRIYG